ncbi:MAG TPA: thiol-disulfide oxidoreductase ResA [Bacillales bacterium]|nr:thiol-disulfide oxidoreductase ResA [Bacillales bacterium]
MKNKKLRLWLRTGILLVFTATVVVTLFQAFNKNETVAQGQLAPNFVLENLDGEEIQLKDFRGKGVLLNFWGSWCEPCKEEMPFLNAVAQEDMEGIVILGINDNEPRYTVKQFVQRNHIQFPILLDIDQVVTSAYNIGPLPTTFFINADGEIVDKVVGQMPNPEFIKNKLKKIQP